MSSRKELSPRRRVIGSPGSMIPPLMDRTDHNEEETDERREDQIDDDARVNREHIDQQNIPSTSGINNLGDEIEAENDDEDDIPQNNQQFNRRSRARTHQQQRRRSESEETEINEDGIAGNRPKRQIKLPIRLQMQAEPERKKEMKIPKEEVESEEETEEDAEPERRKKTSKKRRLTDQHSSTSARKKKEPKKEEYDDQYYEVESVLYMDTEHHLPMEDRKCYVKFKGFGYSKCDFIAVSDMTEGCIPSVELAIDRENAIQTMIVKSKNKGYDFTKRKDFSLKYNQLLREAEDRWNAEAEQHGKPMLFFENWSNIRDIKSIPSAQYIAEHLMSDMAMATLKKKKKNQKKKKQCPCKDNCDKKCGCKKRNGGLIMKNGRLDASILRSGMAHQVSMCDESCSCKAACSRAHMKLKRQTPLVCLFVPNKGWGLFTPYDLPAGSYVGKYIGRVAIAAEDMDDFSYQYTVVGDEKPRSEKEMFVINSKFFANETRFFNNACGINANVVAVNIFTPKNSIINDITFFTKRKILAGEELTIQYAINSNKYGVPCHCSATCKRKL